MVPPVNVSPCACSWDQCKQFAIHLRAKAPPSHPWKGDPGRLTFSSTDEGGLDTVGVEWPLKPDASKINDIEAFKWDDTNEDSNLNRQYFMDYLQHEISWAEGHSLADARIHPKLLDTSLPIDPEFKLRGTTDVVLCTTKDINNDALRNNIKAHLELKKPDTMKENDHSPEAVLGDLAASDTSTNHAVVTVLTDLGESWTFFWFARDDSRGRAVIQTLVLESDGEWSARSLAKYLLESITKEESRREFLPDTFADRLSIEKVVMYATSAPPESGGADSSGASDMISHLRRFRYERGNDIGDELDLLDMVGEVEREQIFRSFAKKHILRHMFGGMMNDGGPGVRSQGGRMHS